MSERLPDERVTVEIKLYPQGIIPCGYTVDKMTKQTCDADPLYIIRLQGYDVPGTVCAKHAAFVRAWPDLEEIKSI
jgi:hypothetical protein